MSIKAIKLITGEDIVADVDLQRDEEIVLTKPMSIHLMPSEEGIGLQMLPWAIYVKNHGNIVINHDKVIFCTDPSIDVRNRYAEMTGLPTIPDDSITIPNENSNIIV